MKRHLEYTIDILAEKKFYIDNKIKDKTFSDMPEMIEHLKKHSKELSYCITLLELQSEIIDISKQQKTK